MSRARRLACRVRETRSRKRVARTGARGGAVPLFAISCPRAKSDGRTYRNGTGAPPLLAAFNVKARLWPRRFTQFAALRLPDILVTAAGSGRSDMAEDEVTPEQLAAIAAENEEPEAVDYKAPAQKSVKEIHDLDKDDESLRKYKEALLGSGIPETDPASPNVQVTRMSLMCETAPNPLVLDLQGDLEAFKKQAFVLKEGVEYKIKISFKVNKEIVSGLKYVQQTFRKGMKIDKSDYMVGSYGPRPAEYDFLTTMEEAPKGILARGNYVIKSKFTDDDKHDHLSWEWNLNIKKDWKD
ncbi:rho GDP-dissociation inhibitor 1-like isoform X1 [Embiotoca jacksoni]|uniref:rho GDP-dissociation inhibitor 1-like isoform X1 n=3 Tax=Embiotocidae TaxID=50791 RepID=UPI003704B061